MACATKMTRLIVAASSTGAWGLDQPIF